MNPQTYRPSDPEGVRFGHPRPLPRRRPSKLPDLGFRDIHKSCIEKGPEIVEVPIRDEVSRPSLDLVA